MNYRPSESFANKPRDSKGRFSKVLKNRVCPQCKEVFKPLLSKVRYCTSRCAMKSKRTGRIILCACCRKETYKALFELKLGANCCSRSCAAKIKVHTPERNRKIGIAHRDEKNNHWKGDKVGYCALHEWVRRRLFKPKLCSDCNSVPPVDLANISQEYRRDLSDWEWLCRRCHMNKDGRMEMVMLGYPRRKDRDRIYVSR